LVKDFSHDISERAGVHHEPRVFALVEPVEAERDFQEGEARAELN
jgi:hypothetical protein